MEQKYKYLLSPIEINGVLFRNRMTATPCNPHFVQGQEDWPTDAVITHYAKKAKNGAAVVCCKGNNPSLNLDLKDCHTQHFNLYNSLNHHYFVQMSDQVHYYGGKAQLLILPPMKKLSGYDCSTGILSECVAGDGSVARYGQEAPRELLYELVEDYAQEAKLAKNLGFDMCYMHMAYRLMFPSRFLSPLTNKRTDEFGGSLENRARFPLMICDAIKKACGPDFLIELAITGEEASAYEGRSTIEDTVEFARLAQGKVDILQIRGHSIDPSQPTNVDPRVTPTREITAEITRRIREKGINMKITFVGGAHNPEIANEMIKNGECDFVGSARSWICDPEYGKKAYEGRGEDVVPCLRCNKCHIPSPDFWYTGCSVNPTWGLEHKIERMISPVERLKKVAVVGGGIAGMEAAIECAKRGHDVTLYEQAPQLGGVINCMDGMPIKWTLENFKNYMIRQTQKNNVRVHLNTKATSDMLKAENYEEVIVAVGAKPIVPSIPGVEKKNVYQITQVKENETNMAEDVVMIGGGEAGAEMAITLADAGHKVTIIEMRDQVAADAAPVHFRSMLAARFENHPNITIITSATVIEILDNTVKYLNQDGEVLSVIAGSVVLAVGMKADHEMARSFADCGGRVHFIGDCDKAGNVMNSMRAGFAIANNI